MNVFLTYKTCGKIIRNYRKYLKKYIYYIYI